MSTVNGSSSASVGYLKKARYGKDLVRVARVVREGDIHHVIEYTVRVMLEGDIETSYTEADNSCVVATDTMKNTVYSLHFVKKYAHISHSFIDLIVHRWSRIDASGKPHGWAFLRDGDEKQTVSVEVSAEHGKDVLQAKVTMGMKDLLVMKTGGSAFEGFHRDEFTTLPEVSDRIFSTSVTLNYDVALPPNTPLSSENLATIGKEMDFAKIFDMARQVTLETFATDNSASVQATMYNTAQKLLAAAPSVMEVSYSYPNKHYIAVNLSPFNLDNGLGREGGAEVFHPVADPSGLITATIARK